MMAIYANQSSRIALSNDSVFNNNNNSYNFLIIITTIIIKKLAERSRNGHVSSEAKIIS